MTTSVKQAWVALRAIVYSGGFVLLWYWAAVVARRYDPELGITLPGSLRPLGFVLAIAGALLCLSCIATFVSRGEGTPAPFDAPRRFVAAGPYRYVRNPMYIGGIAVLAGAGLVLGSLSILLLALAFWALVHLLVWLYEEPTLEHQFGESYTEYKRQVHRWWPGFGASRPR